MKKIPFDYSPIAWRLMIVVAAVFCAGAVLNVIRAIIAFNSGFHYIMHAVLALICVLLLFSDVFAMCYGRYVFKGHYLVCRFGLVFFKYDLNKAFQITEFPAQKKLVVYFAESAYTVAVIKEKYYKEFYEAAREINPRITYTVSE